jgi:hypothetical protein
VRCARVCMGHAHVVCLLAPHMLCACVSGGTACFTGIVCVCVRECGPVRVSGTSDRRGPTHRPAAGWVGQRHSQPAPSKVPTKPAQAHPPACGPGPVLPPPPPPPSPTRPAEQANGTTTDSESRRSQRERAKAKYSMAYTLNWAGGKGPIFNFASSCTYIPLEAALQGLHTAPLASFGGTV